MAAGLKALTPVQQAFLVKYLGASESDGAEGSDSPPAKALPLWMAAREEVDAQVDALQNALKSQTLPLFRKIADAGLHGITSGQLTRLQAALMDLDRLSGPDRAKALPKAQKAVAEMRAFLGSNPLLPLLERNPFGVTVAVRSTLGRALGQLDPILAEA